MCLPRHMTLSLLGADLKGNILGRTVYSPGLIVVAFIVAKLWSGGKESPQYPPPKHNEYNVLVGIHFVRWIATYSVNKVIRSLKNQSLDESG